MNDEKKTAPDSNNRERGIEGLKRFFKKHFSSRDEMSLQEYVNRLSNRELFHSIIRLLDAIILIKLIISISWVIDRLNLLIIEVSRQQEVLSQLKVLEELFLHLFPSFTK